MGAGCFGSRSLAHFGVRIIVEVFRSVDERVEVFVVVAAGVHHLDWIGGEERRRAVARCGLNGVGEWHTLFRLSRAYIPLIPLGHTGGQRILSFKHAAVGRGACHQPSL